MNDEEVKICAQCKHSHRFGSFTYFCKHPKNMVLDVVSGIEEPKYSCQDMRTLISKCGIEGKLFEKRTPIPLPIIEQPSPRIIRQDVKIPSTAELIHSLSSQSRRVTAFLKEVFGL